MKRKPVFIILGIILMSALVVNLYLRRQQAQPAPLVSDIASCDRDPPELCVVTFGASDPGLMVIHFQLPREDYPLFNVTGLSRGISHQYSCYLDKAASTSVYCTGPRTSLGEYIELQVYAVEGNIPLARGKIFVAAVMVWTPGSTKETTSTSETPAAPDATPTASPMSTSETPAAPADATPTASPMPFFTPPTEIVYPNPDQSVMTPFPAPVYPNP